MTLEISLYKTASYLLPDLYDCEFTLSFDITLSFIAFGTNLICLIKQTTNTDREKIITTQLSGLCKVFKTPVEITKKIVVFII